MEIDVPEYIFIITRFYRVMADSSKFKVSGQ